MTTASTYDYNFQLVDLNEDHQVLPNHHDPQFHLKLYGPSSSSSTTSPPSYPDYFFNPPNSTCHDDQVDVPYNNNHYQEHRRLPYHQEQSCDIHSELPNDDEKKKKNHGLKFTIWSKGQDHLNLGGDQSSKWMSSKMRITKKLLKSDDHHQIIAPAAAADKSTITVTTEGQRQPSSSVETAEISSCNSNSSPGGGRNFNVPVRVCTDCNTTKTPLWRSGPRGPKSLCNACGIRQRKARRALAAAHDQAAAAAANHYNDINGGNQMLLANSNSDRALLEASAAKLHHHKKAADHQKGLMLSRHINGFLTVQQKKKRSKISKNNGMSDNIYNIKTNNRTTNSNYSIGCGSCSSTYLSSTTPTDHLYADHHFRYHIQGKKLATHDENSTDQKRKLWFEAFAADLTNNLSLNQVFPQDEKDAAILLMALSCDGLAHG